MKHSFLYKNVRKILVISVIVQCLCVAAFLYSFIQIRRMAERNTKIFMDHFVEKVTAELNRSNTYMRRMILSPEKYTELFSKSGMDRVNLLSGMQNDYAMLNESSERRYNYFAQDLESGDFLELTAVKLPFSAYEKIRFEIKNAVQKERENGTWYLMQTQQGNLIWVSWKYQNFVLGAWIDEESLLSGISMLDYGENGGIGLVKKEMDRRKELWAGVGISTLYYVPEGVSADFEIRILISQSSGMNWLMLVQLVQFILSLLVMAILAALIWYLGRNFVIPVSNLTNILNKYQGNIPEEEQVKEAVGDAFQILDKLGAQMDNMQIKLYESELEKKQLQINFRNLQIRPHFFVNCLAMIQGMADMNDVEKIKAITVYLSEYYRYVLHDCMDMVTLGQELYHLQNVERVNGEWSAGTFVVTQQVEKEAVDARIPVLSVSTFLENSIRHSVGTVRIHLTAGWEWEKEQRYLYVRLEDDGRGFPEALMESLNRGQPVPEAEGRHIGINNVMQRMRLIYGGREKLRFSRGKMGGACVELWFPDDRKDPGPDKRTGNEN